MHVIELKILRSPGLPGVAQLSAYMAHKKRGEGWLVFFDARKPTAKRPLPKTIKRPNGIIRTVVVDINPLPPSKM